MLLGLDEVGRGPWAGPLVVGAVILGPQFTPFTNLNGQAPSASDQQLQTDPLYATWQALTDSKKLTARRREALNEQILQTAAATSLGWVSAEELDRHGLAPALKLAARRAVKQVLRQNIPFDEIIIDGTINLLADTPLANRVSLLKKADLLIKEVSAASIIAKVARDRYMMDIAEAYPAYHFERHVGYGTALHRQTLLKYGPCPEHRRSFRPIREIISELEQPSTPSAEPLATSDPATSTKIQTTTDRGRHAELIVAQYLEDQGHQLLAHNYKTKTYEIDLISTHQQQIFFTEVKYRQNANHGSALAQVTPRKHQQMQYAAAAFLATHPAYRDYQPLLAVGTVSGSEFDFGNWLVLTS